MYVWVKDERFAYEHKNGGYYIYFNKEKIAFDFTLYGALKCIWIKSGKKEVVKKEDFKKVT